MSYHDAECSNGLLQTDIGLIAVNETHAVFSIRIERAKLAENHFFLNVISDIAGGDDRLRLPQQSGGPFSPASDLPARLGKWRRIAALSAAVVAFSALPLITMADATGEQPPPFKILSAELLTPTVVPGGELILKVVAQRSRDCQTTVTRAIFRESDGASVHQESVPSAAAVEASSRPSTYSIAVQIPHHLSPGRYQYRATALSDCGDKIFAAYQPTLPFEVLAPVEAEELETPVTLRQESIRGSL